MRKILIATCALALLAACGGVAQETKTEVFTKEQFDAACVFDAGNGVYKLKSSPCPLDGAETLSQFVGFHPELEIISLGMTNYSTYVITKKKM